MKLIADGGSTKVSWCLTHNGTVIDEFTSGGINPVTMRPADVHKLMEEDVFSRLGDKEIEDVWYYGAGCRGGKYNMVVSEPLTERYIHASVHVASDMTGAARALLGARKGIACILGTGSNSALCDKGIIETSVPSLGYILDDEGSGTALGKALLSALYKGLLPKELLEMFELRYHITLPEVLENVYKNPMPNRFIASFAPFLKDNIDIPDIKDLVCQSFYRFLERNVARYHEWTRMQVGFVGSVAFHFEPQLREVCKATGVTVSKILKSPMDGLIYYHSKH